MRGYLFSDSVIGHVQCKVYSKACIFRYFFPIFLFEICSSIRHAVRYSREDCSNPISSLGSTDSEINSTAKLLEIVECTCCFALGN